MSEAAAAREAALQFEAKKDSLRQHQDGTWRITFTAAPGGLPPDLTQAPPGTRYLIVLVEIGDDEAPKIPPDLERRRRAVQQAGMLPQIEQFRTFLRAHAKAPMVVGKDPVEHCAEIVRRLLGVASRAEIRSDDAALAKWETILAEYEQWQRSHR